MDSNTYCIVTGGSSGIGKEIARGLSQVRGHVAIAARSKSKCEEAKLELASGSHMQSSCSCHELDLADLVSVRRFCSEVERDMKTRRMHLGILVNNAGVWTTKETHRGEDLTFRTNHLGPFHLTNLLLPLMEPGTRIINVSSRAHKAGSLSFDKSDGSPVEVQRTWINKATFGFSSYAQSKLCNVLFTAELQRRLKDRRILSFATSPGPVNTSLFRSLPSPLHFLLQPFAQRLFRTPVEGAASSVYAALSPDLNLPEHIGTIFIHDNKRCEPSAMSQDEDLAAKLWNYSERIIQLQLEASSLKSSLKL